MIAKIVEDSNIALYLLHKNMDLFKDFLSFQARLHKYDFHEALMLYIQRPDATACATVPEWNKINRRIHKGTKGMPIFSNDGQRDIKYVYDLKDTYGKPFKYENTYKIPPEMEKGLLWSLQSNFESDSFSKNIKHCIANHVFSNIDTQYNSYVQTTGHKIGLDEFTDTILDCVGYIVCEKYDISKGFYDSEDSLLHLPEFDNEKYMLGLGTVVQSLSKDMIQRIQVYVRVEEERRKKNDYTEEKRNRQGNPERRENTQRNNDGNRSENSENDRGRNSGDRERRNQSGTNREVWQNVSRVHEGGTPRQNDLSGNSSQVGGNSTASGQRSEGNVPEPNGVLPVEEPTTNKGLSGNSSVREHHESVGGRNRVTGSSLQTEIEENKEPEFQGSFSLSENQEIIDNNDTIPQYLESDLDFYQDQIETIGKENADETNPFVVFHRSGNTNIRLNEVIPFWEAEEHLQNVEKEQRNKYGISNPFENTLGTIFYKENDKLSTYSFIYDLGFYKNTGIYNHISYYREYLEKFYEEHPNLNNFFAGSRDTITEIKELLKILDGYRSEILNANNNLPEIKEPKEAEKDFQEDLKVVGSYPFTEGTAEQDELFEQNNNVGAVSVENDSIVDNENKSIIASSAQEYGKREFKNYNTFVNMFPQIAFGEYDYLKCQAEGYMPLVIENIGDSKISMAHYAYQNGDAMRDPEMTFEIDHENQEITAITFENSFLGLYQDARRGNYVDTKLEKDLNIFISQWLQNISEQGFMPKRASLYNSATTFYFDENGVMFEEQSGNKVAKLNEQVLEENKPSMKQIDRLNLINEDFKEEKKETLASADSIEFEDSLHENEPYLSDSKETHENKAFNYIISSDDDVGMASGKTKFRYNIEAIKLVKQLSEENRQANEEEQRILANYSGFGGIPQAFDGSNENWNKEYQELKETLSEDEYERVRGTVLNAHYTSPEVIQAMYDGLKQLGFKGGSILDPALGTGNFFGSLPDSLKDNSRLFGVEIDEITGQIAKQLYPSAEITINGFEDTAYPDNFFDAAVGNVPFGNYSVFDQKYYRMNMYIHDYFFAKALDKVKPEGVIAFITTKGTMDKENPKIRQYLAERAELLGAIRLPNNTFIKSANTEVTTDIIFLKKRDRIIDASSETWVKVGKYEIGEKNEYGEPIQINLNNYYINNPHMMLGEMKIDKSMYGKETDTALHPFSKPEIKEPIERLNDYVQYLKRNNNFNDTQLRWLETLEEMAVTMGPLSNTMLNEFFIIARNGGYVGINRIFDGQLNKIMEGINNAILYEPEDKSNVALKVLLSEAVNKLPENVIAEAVSFDDLEEEITLPADPNIKNYSYTIIDEKIYQRENSVMIPVELSKTAEERVKRLIELRDTAKKLIDIQLKGCNDEQLSEAQAELNVRYDGFFAKYGYINSSYNKRLFGEDTEYPLLSALESKISNKEYEKADIFFKRTLYPIKEVKEVETSVDALAVCLNDRGCIDLGYMSSLVNKPYMEVIDDLKGIIFKDPVLDVMEEDFDIFMNWQTSDEYLSGDVTEKLEAAKEFAETNEIYAPNVAALEKVQPEPIEAHEISIRIGSSWINPEYYEEFIKNHFKPNSNDDVSVRYSRATNTWRINKPSSRRNSITATREFGTQRMDAYVLLENLLNQKSPKIYDTKEDDEGKEKRVLNHRETIAIKDKADIIQRKFKNWLFEDLERRNILVERYNTIYNRERVRQFDGSFLQFNNMNPLIALRQNQSNAVARILFQGNSLLAHVVGAGKTYTMAAAGMEMKRLGLATKPMFVVPNHLVNQWTNEFKTLYPTADILAATKNDFEKSKRQRFCARVATGEWDAVIIGHSSFFKIPMSIERQRERIYKDLKLARSGLEDANKSGLERYQIKDIERSIKSLEAKLEKLSASPKDNVITFEQLGVDALFVDEADMFKNKFMFTKMGNIAGLSKASSQKSYDMDIKCQYINEINGSERGVIFATGTPVSNSMVELYTMQTYLQRIDLAKRNLEYFDNWAADFGEVVSSLELKPSGEGFRVRDRFAKFVNLPDLMNMFRKVADIQTAEMLKLPVPKIKTGKPVTVAVEPSPSQRALVKALSDLSDRIERGLIQPYDYNMLCVTNDGRLGALDMRCVDVDKIQSLYLKEFKHILPELEQLDFISGKVQACIDNAFDIYLDTAENKSTQMIFCDVSTPKSDGTFSVYDEIKKGLIEKGVDENEISFIHDAKTDNAKEELFEKVRTGEIRVLIGSTSKMGAGTNCQKRLIALHHLDCPWRPRDLEQREGRIVRFGNDNPEVQIYNYVTKGTFDTYLWQIIEAKQKFISQVMSGKSLARTMEAFDQTTLNYAEVKAIATGNPLIRQKMQLEIDVNRLRVLEQEYNATKYSLQNAVVSQLPTQISILHQKIFNIEHDIKLRDKNRTPEFSVKMGNSSFTERKEAGSVLRQIMLKDQNRDKEIGEIMGFKLISVGYFKDGKAYGNPFVTLKGTGTYVVELSSDSVGSMQRIENAINSLEGQLEESKQKLAIVEKQLFESQMQLKKPFEYENDLINTERDLKKVNEQLNIGVEDKTVYVMEEEPETEEEYESEYELDNSF